MSIYTDFDASYGDYYSGIPAGDHVDILNGGTVVENINFNDSSVVDGNIIFETGNVEGGTDTFINGEKVSHTQPNIYGGEDTYEDTSHTHTTIPNEHGGEDIYEQDFRHEGTTFSNVYGSEDYLAEGNTSEILLNDNPLRYAQSVKFANFDMADI